MRKSPEAKLRRKELAAVSGIIEILIPLDDRQRAAVFERLRKWIDGQRLIREALGKEGERCGR